MSGDEDAKDGNVDGRDKQGCSPLQAVDGLVGFADDRYSVDDDLHQQLDLKDPEEEDEEQRGDTAGGPFLSATSPSIARLTFSDSPGAKRSTEQTVSQDHDADVGDDLTPDHVNVVTPPRVLAPFRLLDGLPDGQEAEPERKAHGQGGDRLVLAVIAAVVGHLLKIE